MPLDTVQKHQFENTQTIYEGDPLINLKAPNRKAQNHWDFSRAELLVGAIFVTSSYLSKIGAHGFHFGTIPLTCYSQGANPAENTTCLYSKTTHCSQARHQPRLTTTPTLLHNTARLGDSSTHPHITDTSLSQQTSKCIPHMGQSLNSGSRGDCVLWLHVKFPTQSRSFKTLRCEKQ